MSGDLRAFASGEPRPVDLASVERELTALWKAAGEAKDPAQSAVMRACALNLLVFDRRGDGPALEETLREVTVHHPCRILLARVETGRPQGSLESWVTALCHMGGTRGSQVCSEQVTVVAAPEDAHHLAGAVLPLAVAELPVFIWWRAPLPAESGKAEDTELFEHFVGSADRLLFDQAELGPLRALLRGYPETAFGHLDWARLTPWRTALAQLFDPPPAREYLSRLSKARVEGGDTPARLLAGWLRGRLKGLPAPELARGPLQSVTLDAAGACFRLVRGSQDRPAEATLTLAGAEPIQRQARLPEVTDHQALAEELRFVGHDQVFEEALEHAANL